jgi:hypothetical protein
MAGNYYVLVAPFDFPEECYGRGSGACDPSAPMLAIDFRLGAPPERLDSKRGSTRTLFEILLG